MNTANRAAQSDRDRSADGPQETGWFMVGKDKLSLSLPLSHASPKSHPTPLAVGRNCLPTDGKNKR